MEADIQIIANNIKDDFSGKKIIDVGRVINFYESIYGVYENKELYSQEIKELDALSKILYKYNNHNKAVMFEACFKCPSNSIFKTPNDCWTIWDTDTINVTSFQGIYDNSYDACMKVLDLLYQNSKEIINIKKDFYKLSMQDLSESELINSSIKLNVSIKEKNKTRKNILS